MLYWANKLKDLDFRQLMEIYEEGNLENAEIFYSDAPQNQWLQLAEDAFYQYLRETFFQTPGAVYAIWTEGGRYVSALRLEPYRDGLLLEALETDPRHRNEGYAAALIRAVLKELKGKRVYSHVGKRNAASLAVHEKCGFYRISETAAYIDGSVDNKAYTLSTHK